MLFVPVRSGGMEIFMEYITAREAAQKWNISERLVQKYCAAGRIEGAKKFGNSWGIPGDAPKPKDPRKAGKEQAVPGKSGRAVYYPGLMPLMSTAFEPGKCLETIREMPEGPRRSVAFAEYYYFSGRHKEALREAELLLHDGDAGIGEIAEKLRFSDQFHFSHLFKKVYGMSPLSFRKAGRERNRQLYRS